MSDSTISFSPERVSYHFNAITKLSHPSANQAGVSGNENPVREYVASVGNSINGVQVVFYNETATEPGSRVVVLRRLGSSVYAGKLPIILQAHMDMVFNPVDMKFPLDVIVNPDAQLSGKWIKAREDGGRDSTLGADDGIGVATALALLEDPNLKDYPIECLFTVQEETDMGGAQNFDLDYLTGRTLLNLDAEDLTVIIYGSAGGCETEYNGAITRIAIPDGYCTLELSISGLCGGHSGVDINKGRLNAIKVLTQILVRLDNRFTALDKTGSSIGSYDLLINDFKRCDVIKANAIPAAVDAVVCVPVTMKDGFIADFKKLCETVKIQNQPEENSFAWEITEASGAVEPLDEQSTDTLLGILQQIPSGVIAMIPAVPGVVETSSNLYNVSIANNAVTINSSYRSSCDLSLFALKNIQFSIGAIFEFTVNTGINCYPSWQPNNYSDILKTAKTVYGEKYSPYQTTVIHAGLECGTISARYAKAGITMDCISIGPTIKNPHTPNESLQVQDANGIETVEQFYDAVSQIIVKVFK